MAWHRQTLCLAMPWEAKLRFPRKYIHTVRVPLWCGLLEANITHILSDYFTDTKVFLRLLQYKISNRLKLEHALLHWLGDNLMKTQCYWSNEHRLGELWLVTLMNYALSNSGSFCASMYVVTNVFLGCIFPFIFLSKLICFSYEFPRKMYKKICNP